MKKTATEDNKGVIQDNTGERSFVSKEVVEEQTSEGNQSDGEAVRSSFQTDEDGFILPQEIDKNEK